jgi:hypothetical protein
MTITPSLDAAAIRAELELELEWREAEIRFLQGLGSNLSEDKLGQYRRSIVLVVYAHLEGFFKSALEVYAVHLNGANCKVGDVAWAIAAASLATVFKRLRDNDQKSKIFRRKLPDSVAKGTFLRSCRSSNSSMLRSTLTRCSIPSLI